MALLRPHGVMKLGCCLPVGGCSYRTYPPPSPTMDTGSSPASRSGLAGLFSEVSIDMHPMPGPPSYWNLPERLGPADHEAGRPSNSLRSRLRTLNAARLRSGRPRPAERRCRETTPDSLAMAMNVSPRPRFSVR